MIFLRTLDLYILIKRVKARYIFRFPFGTLSIYGFSKGSLLNAFNSIHKYDIISLCETSLGFNEIVPENIIQGYHYHACNYPSGEKNGGVGIFYKDSSSIIIRNDLSFDTNV